MRVDHETRDAEHQALLQLAQSPGWALLKTLWRKRSLVKEQAKADALRSKDFDRALNLQGELDGLREAERDVTVLIREHELAELPTPGY